MSAPHLDRGCASAILALVAAAKVHAPEAPLAWLVGWAMRAAGEPVERAIVAPRVDPRREPEDASVTLGKVPLVRRP